LRPIRRGRRVIGLSGLVAFIGTGSAAARRAKHGMSASHEMSGRRSTSAVFQAPTGFRRGTARGQAEGGNGDEDSLHDQTFLVAPHDRRNDKPLTAQQ